MFIRTYENELVNVKDIQKAYILSDRVNKDFAHLMVNTPIENYDVFYGTLDDCLVGMDNLCEAFAKGASLISYYSENNTEGINNR